MSHCLHSWLLSELLGSLWSCTFISHNDQNKCKNRSILLKQYVSTECDHCPFISYTKVWYCAKYSKITSLLCQLYYLPLQCFELDMRWCNSVPSSVLHFLECLGNRSEVCEIFFMPNKARHSKFAINQSQTVIPWHV